MERKGKAETGERKGERKHLHREVLRDVNILISGLEDMLSHFGVNEREKVTGVGEGTQRCVCFCY